MQRRNFCKQLGVVALTAPALPLTDAKTSASELPQGVEFSWVEQGRTLVGRLERRQPGEVSAKVIMTDGSKVYMTEDKTFFFPRMVWPNGAVWWAASARFQHDSAKDVTFTGIAIAPCVYGDIPYREDGIMQISGFHK